MDYTNNVSVFIPYKVLHNLNLSHAYLFGYCNDDNSSKVEVCRFSVKANNYEPDILNLFTTDGSNENRSSKVQFLGVIYQSKNKKFSPFSKIASDSLWFILHVDIYNNAFFLENVYNNSIEQNISVCFVLYDDTQIFNSSLFCKSMNIDDCKNFPDFLMKSLSYEEKFIFTNHSNYQVNDYSISETTTNIFCFISNLVLFIKTFFQIACPDVLYRGSKYFIKMMRFTQIGHHFYQRIIDCKDICLNWETEKALHLKFKNLLFTMMLDFIFGWLIMVAVWKSQVPILWLKTSVTYTNSLVNGLQKLIYWLMGVPGGLKLNIPLNYALGHFFLYHIYLWEAYITVVFPVFYFMLKASTFVGIFGLTFYLCLISDLISLATIHIYCFYGYATRLYGYLIACLSSLWRLFRGKKWNPLRQRVDSHSYDVHQLYLGSLIFTVLLFLLPTVVVYYFVFACLRILVLIVQGLISKLIECLTILPLYSLILKILKSNDTAGKLYFSIYSSKATVVLSMQAVQASYSTVIMQSIPKRQENTETLSWKNLIVKILHGDIIYPI